MNKAEEISSKQKQIAVSEFFEKNKHFLFNHDLSKKILICIFPILPRLASQIYTKIFKCSISKEKWPIINLELIQEDHLTLPIQIKGKLVTTINTKKNYSERDILEKIYKLEKIRNKVSGKKIIKVINVQDKIINIITN